MLKDADSTRLSIAFDFEPPFDPAPLFIMAQPFTPVAVFDFEPPFNLAPLLAFFSLDPFFIVVSTITTILHYLLVLISI